MHIGFKAHYFEKLAELEEGNFWFRSRNKLILWALQKYSPSPQKILEVGCGTGFVISGIAKKFPNAKLLGSEYLEEGLVFARLRVPNAEFTQMDARHIPYVSELDVVGAFDVLEHIEEDTVVLQQMYKALNPGGMVFISVPQHRWLWSEVDEYACHVRRYDSGGLHRKIKDAGFEIKLSTSFISMLLPAMYVSRLFKRKKEGVKMDAMAELSINPILNKFFEWVLSIELALIRIGINLPVGGSRLIVAKKPLLIMAGE